MLNHVFSKLKVGNCVFPNRFLVPAMVTNYCTVDGMITDRYIAYMAEKAKGGYGVLITEDYCIQEHMKGYARITGLWKDDQIEGNKKLTETIHSYGSKIFCQMYHPGKQATFMSQDGVQPVAPSSIKDPLCQALPRELTVDEIHQIVKDFGSAAKRCEEAGFDGIEIHAGHGYLIAEFLSPFINKRNDEYGGCFENRVRFLDEIYNEIRKNTKSIAVTVRFSANEYVTGGRTEVESYQLAIHLDQLGIDGLNISNGAYASDATHQIIAPMFTDHGINVDVAGEIKKMVSCPVFVANRINNPSMIDAIIAGGKVDAVCVGRGSIADPDMPNKAKEGRFDEINYCLGCLQGCGNSLFGPKQEVDCLVNPRVGQEYKDCLCKVENPKNVLVAGAGPAGLMAARTAAQKGHNVTLYEATNHLGGAFRAAAYPSGKGDLATLVASYSAQCKKLGVDIIMNTPVTEDILKEANADTVIIATGSKPFAPNIEGIERAVNAEDVLYGNTELPFGPVVVCGGGEVGGETAEFIAANMMLPVTILEMQSEILNEMCFQNKVPLLGLLAQRQVQVITNAKVSKVSENTVSYIAADGSCQTIPAVSVVCAFGYKAYNPLEEIANKYCDDVKVIGSAIKAGNAMTAIQEGYQAALNI